MRPVPSPRARPIVSIIIPARNAARHLPGCLESIRGLDFPAQAMEVILVDNGSTDQSREIARRFGATVLCHGRMHVSGLRNLGAKTARGDILAFTDADCTVDPHWLNAASCYFADRDVAAWGGVASVPDNATWVQRTWQVVRTRAALVQEVDWLESMNLFLRSDLFHRIGGFNEALVTCEDVDLGYRVRKFGKIVCDNRIRAVHHGEAGTLEGFFKKELWRGTSNLVGIRSHGLIAAELPSLAIPVYFSLTFPGAVAAAIVAGNPWWLVAGPASSIVPSLAALFRVRGKVPSLGVWMGLVVLFQVYFAARTLAVYRRR